MDEGQSFGEFQHEIVLLFDGRRDWKGSIDGKTCIASGGLVHVVGGGRVTIGIPALLGVGCFEDESSTIIVVEKFGVPLGCSPSSPDFGGRRGGGAV